jgi:hypothetical protein
MVTQDSFTLEQETVCHADYLLEKNPSVGINIKVDVEGTGLRIAEG